MTILPRILPRDGPRTSELGQSHTWRHLSNSQVPRQHGRADGIRGVPSGLASCWSFALVCRRQAA